MAMDTIGIGLIGCGTIGSGVVELLTNQADLYRKRTGKSLDLRAVLVRAQDIGEKTACVPEGLLTTDAETFFATNVDIVIELAGGRGPVSEFVRKALSMGRHVVTANKALLAAEGPELFAVARENNVSIAFEASCGGGIPCINAIQFGLMANEMTGLYGILNGTCNYILTQMTRHDEDYATALAEAQQKGFAEADPTLDVNGSDTAQKLAILASLAFGCRIMGDQVPKRGIDSLTLDDIHFGSELGYDIKLLGTANREPATGQVSVIAEPCFVPRGGLLSSVVGPFNAVLAEGNYIGQTMYYGAGAGKRPTASAVVSDVMGIAAGWYPQAFSQLQLTPDVNEPAKLADPSEMSGRYFIRLSGIDKPGTLAAVTQAFGDQNISIGNVIQHETNHGRFVPVVVTTHQTERGRVDAAARVIAEHDVTEGEPTVIRILDGA